MYMVAIHYFILEKQTDKQSVREFHRNNGGGITSDPNNLQIYCGRLAGEVTPTETQWSKEIDLAEKLLINVHKPAYNTQNLITIPDERLQNIHILNWGYYRDLLPEVSGLRWTSTLDNMDYDIYRYK